MARGFIVYNYATVNQGLMLRFATKKVTFFAGFQFMFIAINELQPTFQIGKPNSGCFFLLSESNPVLYKIVNSSVFLCK